VFHFILPFYRSTCHSRYHFHSVLVACTCRFYLGTCTVTWVPAIPATWVLRGCSCSGCTCRFSLPAGGPASTCVPDAIPGCNLPFTSAVAPFYRYLLPHHSIHCSSTISALHTTCSVVPAWKYLPPPGHQVCRRVGATMPPATGCQVTEQPMPLPACHYRSSCHHPPVVLIRFIPFIPLPTIPITCSFWYGRSFGWITCLPGFWSGRSALPPA